MPSCEKCWRDAGGDADTYEQILRQRNATGNECTPEQQAGRDAEQCPFCLRYTIHIHSGFCMNKRCPG